MLEACPFFVGAPHAVRGRWHDQFDAIRPLHIELGCGRGEFIAQMAIANPHINYLAVDIKDEILLVAMQAVEAARHQVGLAVDNLRLAAFDIERINEVLAPEDRVERIYISFPNPWPKPRHHKHRLVHARQLAHYLVFLSGGGEIVFRTDNADLFEDGLGDLRTVGFDVICETRDLLSSDYAAFPGSEHQRMFAAQGIPISFCIARLPR